ncbi:MAG TPA: type III-A CRISPR-associated RAMP protein Csm5 [Flavilitoribacter sp.]|nr:type III-A CRISPR-associated RAMP protein Csm5 [Flavilitoribacter sp.]
MELRLRTLTPFHIGNGEHLSPLEYVIGNQTYYRLDEKTFSRFLSGVSPEAPKSFAAWITEKYREISRFDIEFAGHDKEFQRQNKKDYNQAFSDLRLSATPLAFCKEENKEEDLLRFLEREKVIKARVNTRDLVKSQVNESLKNGLKQPYLPGSSIKGAIRTALLYHWLTQHGKKSEIKKLVESQLHGKTKDTAMDDTLEAAAFYCEALENGKSLFDEARYDLFKLLMLSDAHLTTPENALELADIKAYVKERSKTAKGKVEFEAVEQRQPPFVEAVSAGLELSAEMNFNIEFLYAIKENIPAPNQAIKVAKNQYWKELADKIKAVFGLDMAELDKIREIDPDLRKVQLDKLREGVHQHILNCLKVFAQRQLEADRQWLDGFIKVDKKGVFGLRMQAGWAPLILRHDLPLLHLGFGAGFRATTALLYFLQDKGMKETFERVMSRFYLGLTPKLKGDRNAREKYQPNATFFPKSKRLIRKEDAIIPPGWLLIGDDLNPEQLIEAETGAAPISAEPEFFQGQINQKRPPELDAVVVKPGNPNQVKVFFTPGKTMELPLQAYRSPLEEGAVIVVQSQVDKKGNLISVSFRRFKK